MSYFNRELNTQLTSAFDLLLQLDGLTGLTYLYDQNNPIIAFAPKAFLIIERSTLQQFDRIEFDQYQKSTTTSILGFTNLDPTSPPKANNVSFQGAILDFLVMTMQHNSILTILSAHNLVFS